MIARSGALDAVVSATKLLAHFGSVATVLASNAEILTSVSGDERAAQELVAFHSAMQSVLRSDVLARPLVSSSAALRDYLVFEMGGDRSESVRVLYLDVKSRLIADDTIFVGTIDTTTFSSREIVRRALDLNAARFILVHNHPSGDPSPSAEDRLRTAEVAAAAALFEIELVDHLVVASGGIVSVLRSAEM